MTSLHMTNSTKEGVPKIAKEDCFINKIRKTKGLTILIFSLLI